VPLAANALSAAVNYLFAVGCQLQQPENSVMAILEGQIQVLKLAL